MESCKTRAAEDRFAAHVVRLPLNGDMTASKDEPRIYRLAIFWAM
jgi:hypothetical protein